MKYFKIAAHWRVRPETPQEIAPRLKLATALLREITPQFARWFQVISQDNAPELLDTEDWLVPAIEARLHADDLGAPVPLGGYFLVTMNSLRTAEQKAADVAILTSIGSSYSGGSAALVSQHDLDWDPALLSYPIVRQTTLALARAFEPMWCTAGPLSLWRDMHISDYKEGPVLTPSWMVYLSPPLAKRITPPKDVSCERFADGSLFLSVTEQTFEPENAEHVAAAHRLFAVLDTLQEKKPREQWRR